MIVRGSGAKTGIVNMKISSGTDIMAMTTGVRTTAGAKDNGHHLHRRRLGSLPGGFRLISSEEAGIGSP